jgi:MacB-like periplasmic core domain
VAPSGHAGESAPASSIQGNVGMSGFRRFWLRLYHSMFPNRAEHDVAREIASHIAILAADYRRRGMSDATAHAAALRRMGSPLRARERHRESRAFPWIEDAAQDVTHAVRLMRRTSGFAAVVIVTVALGIGAATAVFSVVKAVLLEPLPYAEPDALVRVIENLPPAEAPRTYGATPPMMNVASFVTWRERTKVFSHMAAFGYAPPGILTTASGPAQVTRAAVSPALFPMLGIRPLRGRVFEPHDEKPGSAVIVFSETAWRRYFASDDSLVGRAIQLEGRA